MGAILLSMRPMKPPNHSTLLSPPGKAIPEVEAPGLCDPCPLLAAPLRTTPEPCPAWTQAAPVKMSSLYSLSCSLFSPHRLRAYNSWINSTIKSILKFILNMEKEKFVTRQIITAGIC